MCIFRELTATVDDAWVKLLADVGPGNVATLYSSNLNVSIKGNIVWYVHEHAMEHMGWASTSACA